MRVTNNSKYLGLVARKPVFWVSEKAISNQSPQLQRLSRKFVASLHMILSKKRITKVLIRMRGCAGWSAPVLFANPRWQVFSCRGPIYDRHTVCLQQKTFSYNDGYKAQLVLFNPYPSTIFRYQTHSDALKNSFFFLLLWSIPRPQRNLGHSSFSQEHSQSFF